MGWIKVYPDPQRPHQQRVIRTLNCMRRRPACLQKLYTQPLLRIQHLDTCESVCWLVSKALFHPALPIILTGSEAYSQKRIWDRSRFLSASMRGVASQDGTVRIWHGSTYRLEACILAKTPNTTHATVRPLGKFEFCSSQFHARGDAQLFPGACLVDCSAQRIQHSSGHREKQADVTRKSLWHFPARVLSLGSN